MKTKCIVIAVSLVRISCSLCHAESLPVKLTQGFSWSGVTAGRMPSTYRPDYEAELNYYDPCLHAMYVKCPVEISNVGFCGDRPFRDENFGRI